MTSTIEKDHDYMVRQDKIKQIANKIKKSYKEFTEELINSYNTQYYFNFKKLEIEVFFTSYDEEIDGEKGKNRTILIIKELPFYLTPAEKEILNKGFEECLEERGRKNKEIFEEHRKKEQEILNNLVINKQ